MEVIKTPVTPEVMTRLLMQAIEKPQGGQEGSLPQEIITSDREFQFFLRGALKDLDIDITYADQLPFSSELFNYLDHASTSTPDEIPEPLQGVMDDVVDRLWTAAPWQNLLDSQIFRIACKALDSCFFATFLGFLGEEYGVLLYRNLDSLISFRQNVFEINLETSIESDNFNESETAFLRQDCIFLTFNLTDEGDRYPSLLPSPMDSPPSSSTVVVPSFGSIHPLEGLRTYLDEEEAAIIYMGLEAFLKFWQKNNKKINVNRFPALEATTKIKHPIAQTNISWVVSTLPDVTATLQAMEPDKTNPFLRTTGDGLDLKVIPINDNFVPDKSLVFLDERPMAWLEEAKNYTRYYQEGELPLKASSMATLIIQTSQPKVRTMVQTLATGDGLNWVQIVKSDASLHESPKHILMLQTSGGEFIYCNEYDPEDKGYMKVFKQWDKLCRKSGGWCVVLLASGITGKGRMNPQFSDLWAFLEVPYLSLVDD
ncbi:hypothetical protein L3556_00640 [Candidatus Synechococcus calcipolaris G9]|uniref:DUF6930 domain-containing protein n=2 Tax=Synechococcus TaxID=1129 RepID=A0ABT6EU79_9SYNE|nr:hypothetical protein [Candidatus Synechococcus calcipolaris]MDG2989444.1 hypothetical protein [Candidatus Synechococcus calcipolaris G9]